MVILRRRRYDTGMNSDRESQAVLTVAEMGRADAAAIAGGVAGERLMAAAGAAVAAEVMRRVPAGPVAVVCGPGNNGGDGFVAARRLREAGRPVRLALLGARSALKGDAALHAARWEGEVEKMSPAVLDGATVVIDALFGAGLSRPLDGAAREVVDAINDRRLACIGVDVPSGVFGDTGQVLGDGSGAPSCIATVTFFRKKPAHLLLPARELCGEVSVAEIGIPAAVLTEIAPRCHENHPVLWLERFPWPRASGHKYSRGHAVVVGGGTMTGAGRLAARAAARAGAGLVSVAAPAAAIPIYAGASDALIMAPVDDEPSFVRLLEDQRRNAILLGPGAGANLVTRMRVLAALSAHKACVIDADALTAFADDPAHLFRAIRRSPDSKVLLTPHEGELARLFPDVSKEHAGDKLGRARAAAAHSGAVVLLKGADTVIATPDGDAVINSNAPPELATAGTGDVLAGLCLGLIAQGMPPFDAACAAAWLHGEAGATFGPGLIADDIIETIPKALRKLKARSA
jgi:ADP-dependent NAD(P)H-hydrate dehydratase / NAD(P)H-hydrate epimerase